jgi:hypothetical protein
MRIKWRRQLAHPPGASRAGASGVRAGIVMAAFAAALILAAGVAGCGASGNSASPASPTASPMASTVSASFTPPVASAAPAKSAAARPSPSAASPPPAAPTALPAIVVDEPASGSAFPSPGRVTGTADVFEAQFRLQVLDSERRVLTDLPVRATCGSGCRGTFDVTVRYALETAEWGTLRVFDLSAKDGTPTDVSEIPVLLTPSG